MLKKGVVMPMPNIQDKMPKRSFLPQTILSKLLFATSKMAALKQIFHAAESSDDIGVSSVARELVRGPIACKWVKKDKRAKKRVNGYDYG
ncbi:hypothetical protein FF2_026310 [Malus domestica]